MSRLTFKYLVFTRNILLSKMGLISVKSLLKLRVLEVVLQSKSLTLHYVLGASLLLLATGYAPLMVRQQLRATYFVFNKCVFSSSSLFTFLDNIINISLCRALVSLKLRQVTEYSLVVVIRNFSFFPEIYILLAVSSINRVISKLVLSFLFCFFNRHSMFFKILFFKTLGSFL